MIMFPLSAMAIPKVSLSFAGNSTFILTGANLEDVSKLQVAIGYDASTLSNPRLVSITSFSGARVAVDSDSPGALRLTITADTPMNGKGSLAKIDFYSSGNSAGTISSLNGQIYGANGTSLSAMFEYTNPTPPLDPTDLDDIPMIEEREKNGQSYMGGDVTYLPPEAAKALEQSEKTPETKDEDASAAGNSAEKDAESKEKPDTEKAEDPGAVLNVLERFRLFKGERTAKNLMALFDAAPNMPFIQEPHILLADGKNEVQVTIAKVSSGKTPSFAFTSARYVYGKKLSKSEWLVVAKADKGALNSNILMLDNEVLRDIPLTVSPKVRVDLITPGKVSKADFTLYLKNRGTAKAPLFDLNGDGKRDYQDDYIFTANYLVALEKQKTKAVEATASKKTLKTGNSKKKPLKKSTTTGSAKIEAAEGNSKK